MLPKWCNFFFFDRVVNIVAKGEIAWYNILSLSCNVFKRLFLRVVKTQDCLEKGELFTIQFPLLTPMRKRPFENIVGKGENADNQHFLFFP